MTDAGRTARGRLDTPPGDAGVFESRVTVHQLRIFRTVADLASFTRAARELHLSQPAVSHQVKALSEVVGAPLFEQLRRRIQLTEAGRLLYDHAARILAEFEAAGRAIDELHGLERGTLRLAGDTTVGIYVLPDVLGSFKARYPEVEVRLAVGNRQRVDELLVASEADFAVVGRAAVPSEAALVVRPFLPNELVAIAAPGHPLAERSRIPLARLAEEPFIFRERGSGTRETTEEALARSGHAVHVAMELASNGAIKRAVARGLGVAILSRYAVALELRLGTLVELPVAGFPLRRQWHLVYPRGRRLGPVGEAFLSFVDQGSWRDGLGDAATVD